MLHMALNEIELRQQIQEHLHEVVIVLYLVTETKGGGVEVTNS